MDLGRDQGPSSSPNQHVCLPAEPRWGCTLNKECHRVYICLIWTEKQGGLLYLKPHLPITWQETDHLLGRVSSSPFYLSRRTGDNSWKLCKSPCLSQETSRQSDCPHSKASTYHRALLCFAWTEELIHSQG